MCFSRVFYAYNLTIISSHRYADHKMWATATHVAWSVCLSVCLSVSVSVCVTVEHMLEPCKNAEPTEMPFGLWTPVSPGNHYYVVAPIPQGKVQFSGLFSESHWKCTVTASAPKTAIYDIINTIYTPTVSFCLQQYTVTGIVCINVKKQFKKTNCATRV